MTVVWVLRRMGLASYKPKCTIKCTIIVDLLYDGETTVPKSKEDYKYVI